MTITTTTNDLHHSTRHVLKMELLQKNAGYPHIKIFLEGNTTHTKLAIYLRENSERNTRFSIARFVPRSVLLTSVHVLFASKFDSVRFGGHCLSKCAANTDRSWKLCCFYVALETISARKTSLCCKKNRFNGSPRSTKSISITMFS